VVLTPPMLCALFSGVHSTVLRELPSELKPLPFLAHSLLQAENPVLFELSFLDASCLNLRLSLCKMDCQSSW